MDKQGEGSCTSDLTFGAHSLADSDGFQAFDKPNSSMSVTAAALAWGSMTVTMMWFVMG